MKRILFVLLFVISFSSFAQDNHIVKTEDGRRVLLKADFTWEYIDVQKPKKAPLVEKKVTQKEGTNCNISENFKEPKLNSKIQAQLRKGRATINHIKKKVAKEYNCTVNNVQLLSVSETKEKGVYDFCADGNKVRYKRVGNSIVKPLF